MKSRPEIHGPGERIGVLVPMFYRGDRFTDFVWSKFAHQTHADKLLFVCRNPHAFDSKPPYSADYYAARHRWRELQEEHPDTLLYWEQDDYSSLGHKRNMMLNEALQSRYGCRYIATFDDDDVYASGYLEQAQALFSSDRRIKLVKFRDLLGIQINGDPIAISDISGCAGEDLARELEASRAFAQQCACSETSSATNQWHIHTRGGVLPSGFGFSFVMDAEMLREDTSLRYSEQPGVRSGEEDALYKGIEEKFGSEAIVALPISVTWALAAHMEGAANISGDMSVFHFPAAHYVAVPRPLSFVSDEILRFLSEHHPDSAVRKWSDAVSALRLRNPACATLTAVPNVDRTKMFSQVWQQEANWKQPYWTPTSPWFRAPLGLQSGGQDIPIDAREPWIMKGTPDDLYTFRSGTGPAAPTGN